MHVRQKGGNDSREWKERKAKVCAEVEEEKEKKAAVQRARPDGQWWR